MRYGSVCSGIEAATAAWHHMGWKPSFFSEIDNFPRAVLAHHYPEVPLHGDFTTIQDGDYEPIELLVGGTPCQSFSVAGLRKGLDDPRGNLMLEFGALAERLRPTWLVWENVPGVLSANKGRDFGTFLGMLAELGYGFAYRVLDAQYFGVAQRRRRVFVVGYLGDWRPPAAVLFERQSLSGNPAPNREAREEIAGTLTSSLGRRGGVPDGGDTTGQLQPVNQVAWAPNITGSLTARQGQNGGQSNDDVDGNKIIAMAHGQAGAEISINRGPTLTCNHEAPIVCHGTQAIQQKMTVRRLTPVECERLQGFPDNFTKIPYRNKPAEKCPDGPRYKALGNSMAVPVMRWIGERIEQLSSEQMPPKKRPAMQQYGEGGTGAKSQEETRDGL